PMTAMVLGVAVLLRLGALPAPAFLSTDIYRYVWDGRVAAAGINPYRYVPNDPQLAALRDAAVYPRINRANYAPTIYPPMAQMLFLLADRLGGTVATMKGVLVAAEAIAIAALIFLLRRVGAPPERILLYAWHPLPVWEIAGSGHVDAAALMFTALALGASVAGRRAASGAALAGATLVKLLPVVVAPALWRPRPSNRGDWRWPVAFAVVAIALYLPYLGVGWRVLGFLPGYFTEERLGSGGGFWLLDALRRLLPVPTALYLGITLVLMAGLAVGALRRPDGPRASFAWAAVLATAALVFASPHYPWYFVLLVGLLCIASWWPAWWLTLSAFLLYRNPATGHVPFGTGLVIYGGFAVLGCIDLALRTRLWRDRGANR
ncbi:MAG TPA: hypothetical protein VGF07_07530, partial [Stellaceae bacterium]